jgi:hypothetical protein
MVLPTSSRTPKRQHQQRFDKELDTTTHIDAISAILAYTSDIPIATMIKPQNRSAVPPSVSTKVKSLRQGQTICGLPCATIKRESECLRK